MEMGTTVALLMITCLAFGEATSYTNSAFLKLRDRLTKATNGHRPASDSSSVTSQFPSNDNSDGYAAQDAQGRILDGRPVTNQCQAPYNSVVNIIKAPFANADDVEAVCTGTLLAPDLVVTAASCMARGDRYLEDLSTYYGVVGDRYLQSLDTGGPSHLPEQRVNLASGKFHPGFSLQDTGGTVVCTWDDTVGVAGQQAEAAQVVPAVADLDACKALCDGDTQCTIITFLTGTLNRCYLYHTEPSTGPDAAATSSVRSCQTVPDVKDDNIMLIKLASNVTLDDLCVQPMTRYDATINTDACHTFSSNCTILGWGSTAISDDFERNTPTTVLNYGFVNVLTSSAVTERYMRQEYPSESYPLASGVTMVALPFAGSYVGTCNFDHGSMVACPGPDGDYQLRGVLSNHNRCNDAGKVVDTPMYVTDIQLYKEWIDGCLVDFVDVTSCPGQVFP